MLPASSTDPGRLAKWTLQREGAKLTVSECYRAKQVFRQWKPNKHAGSNPEAFWLRPVMANVQPQPGQIQHPASNSVPIFEKAWMILYKIDPDQIWMALPEFGKMHLVWKQAGV